jgi:fibro-slime domain-containing protein
MFPNGNFGEITFTMIKKTIGLFMISLLGFQPVLASEVSPFTYIDIVQNPAPAGQVLGTSTSTTAPTTITTTYTCDSSTLNTSTSGFYGRYFNMSETDIGMKGDTRAYNTQLRVGRDNYWYGENYHAFDRIDADLNFGNNFFPVNTGKAGDPYNFATHWRAVVKVNESKTYKFSTKSDDDSWLLINNQLVIDNGGGATGPRNRSGDIYLNEGYHLFDIYFSQRGVSGSYFSYKNSANELTYYPLSPGCTITDFTNRATNVTVTNNNGGRVLGASTSNYTPAIALYKTANSPAVYAIYANGYRHYITSPTSFYNYGYSFSDVQTVSEAKLNSYPDVRLVRTPDDETIYFIYTRADKQWLKLPIPSPTAFVSYTNNHWGNLVIIDELDRDAYPDAELITANSGDTIYLLKNGEKRRFDSLASLLRLNYNPAEVVSVSQAHLDAYKTGLIIE